ncbi:DMT family transporter [Pseudomonas typographi]|uniref:DMT family transporter n=1 Tax=Pseudomonas typographi TaxID=2715964 RepID=A0ABR7Z6X9_9PSED|nr:DMT family transporter [Pseudomonas typographi]MBD1589619.1 DMT family transporter [Pseudomonas typographi]MBD1601132.1 DMT family transporter [Pseudomonas typographi]
MLDERKSLDVFSVSTMMVLCLLWGGQQVLIKLAAPRLDPLMQLTIRYAISALILGGYLWYRQGAALFGDKTAGAGVLVGILVALESIFIAEGLRYSSASHITLFLYTGPLFASFGLHFLREEERLSASQWCFVVLAFLGIVITFIGRGEGGQGNTLLGDGLGLLSGAAWGATTIAVRTSALANARPEKTLFYQVSIATLLIFPVTFIMGHSTFEMDRAVVANLTFQTLVLVLGTFLGWYWLLTRYLASRLSVLQLLTPVAGVALSVVVLNDVMDRWFVGGAVLVLIGILGVSVLEVLTLRRAGGASRPVSGR